MFGKVLVANRGEIAVRVVRACRDAGLQTVAVYADEDLDALHTTLAGEAFSLGGSGAPGTYLDIGKLIALAERSGADAVHPGYGFLSENADFAEAVLAAGLTWIGPPPAAIRLLGDKTSARRVAERVGAPLAAGLSTPVSGAAEVEAFARAAGLPIIVKAAFGGGGRGMRVVRHLDEIAPALELAVRESTAAFGRGECFVERFVERARHVETQCLADSSGNVVVVSTRDCTLQRRSQKLVEEAPAPFLDADQLARLYDASKAILAEAGYVGAGTCEYLVGPDGSISFNEVNTRLQVEHPVTEEVTGIDLVREQLRLAAGEELGYEDPPSRGHSIEFRLNAEDASRGFLPSGGPITRLVLPGGPGVRLDLGYRQGDVVPSSFDSLIGKLIVTGASRAEALERARRALGELDIEGLPTVLDFHRYVVSDPAFAGEPFAVHTRWIETEMPAQPGPAAPPPSPAPAPGEAAAGGRERVVVEVDGRRLEVTLPAGLLASSADGTARGGTALPGVPAGAGRAAGTTAGEAGRRRPARRRRAGS
ncbi:MAG TPA: biotin carboxylase N-terminal domain-containing protein, partial [Acidimicrobiales bacterium]|nr:biotin carboxylase N-terminal domain-containing protein [Acidimicrobiales bacterium]